jgi:FKBP-type peptidyl-prolyl cis-trans isomerase
MYFMATKRSQRIGIWAIAITMALGTLGTYLVMALSYRNQAIDQKQVQEAYDDYQLKVAMQTMDLSSKYYGEFSKYSTVPTQFDAKSVKTVEKKDLKIGDGQEIESNTKYSAYYIGWNPKGVVFDQSISDNKTLKAPISGGNLIAGWNEGVIGMKVGGVRELTIPSDKAYGSSGSGENIPPNSPIKFIVMIIPKEEIPVPDILKPYINS